jgi:hypothetical protein
MRRDVGAISWMFQRYVYRSEVAYTTPAGARRIRPNGRFRKGGRHSHAHANGGEAASGRAGDPAV